MLEWRADLDVIPPSGSDLGGPGNWREGILRYQRDEDKATPSYISSGAGPTPREEREFFLHPSSPSLACAPGPWGPQIRLVLLGLMPRYLWRNIF